MGVLFLLAPFGDEAALFVVICALDDLFNPKTMNSIHDYHFPSFVLDYSLSTLTWHSNAPKIKCVIRKISNAIE